MKKASEKLKTLLRSKQLFYMSDLFTITLSNGAILHFTNCDVPLTVDGKTYVCMVITRQGTTQTRGIVVDELKLTVETDKQDILPGGLTFMQGVVAGTFANATLRLDRVFSPAPFIFNMPPIDADYVLDWWVGILNIDDAGGLTVEITAASMTQFLNVKFPRNLYYPPCTYTLGDSECGVILSQYQTNGTVLTGSTKNNILTNLTLADGYLTQGSITFASGSNTNVTRTIKSFAGKQITTILPFQYIPQPGDAFTVCPGCTKSMDCCKTRFNNLNKFRGFPFIPTEATAY